jgi:ureidoglycolate hydrolase
VERVLEAQPFDAEAWAPYGWVPLGDHDPDDGRRTLEFEWHDAHLNRISHRPDEVTRLAEGLVVDRLFRHDTHTQALVPLNCESVIVVAPSTTTFADAGDLDALRAFRLRPLDQLVLDRGTWHWGPFPTGDVAVELLNLQGRRYGEDNASVDLSERAGGSVAVRVGA